MNGGESLAVARDHDANNPDAAAAFGSEQLARHRFGIAAATLGGAAAWPLVALAQPGQTSQPPPNAVSVEQSAVFDVTPVTGTLISRN
jgi:hypothetical protein